ncbi:MAG: amino acid adenylation domain-containing protein [Polyangiaceae bacterium]|nr:amino acid adenylation domain-containing protein [Polyangiaceae bacterium]
MRPYLIPQLLDRAVERTPHAVALVEPKKGATPWTYADLDRESLRVATALAELDVGPGDLVGICMEKTVTAVAGVYGILRRGAAYVPIDPSMPRPRAEKILANAGIAVTITTPDRLGFFDEARAQAPALSRVLVTGAVPDGAPTGLTTASLASFAPELRSIRHVTGGYLAYVLHTSGSTGQPKGVAITHDNCLAFVEPATSRFSITAADRLACQAPLHFDLSVFDLYCAALAGAAVVILPEHFSAFPKKMTQAIADHGVTIWNSVVSALALLADKGGLADAKRDSLRAVIFSGERMPIPLLRRLRDILPAAKLYNVYGQTEANSSLVEEIGDIPNDDGASLPLGRPLPNFETFLIDEAGKVIDDAEATGELCVRAGTVASGGYLRDEGRSKEKFILDPRLPETGMRVYRTGDLARRDASGELTFAGRRDDMIKTRGYRVELGEVQAAFDRVAEIVESAVIAVPNPAIGYELRAFVQLSPTATLTPAEIASRISEGLPAYMVPERIEVRDALPRTSTGKIDKKALAAETT